MKTFETHKLQHDLLTGKVYAEYSISVDGKELTPCKNEFASPQGARIHLAGIKRDLLNGWLDGFVNHKRHIIESGNHNNQTVALNRCTDMLKYIHANRDRVGLVETCRIFLRKDMRPYFDQILPHPNNPSYQSSCDALQSLRAFCEECVNEALTK